MSLSTLPRSAFDSSSEWRGVRLHSPSVSRYFRSN